MKGILLILLSLLCFTQEISASTDVQLSVNSSNVANIYYQIYGNNQPIYDELEFFLVDTRGKEIQVKTNKSILFLKNIPFGNYELELKDKPFTYQLTIDKQYLKTQHLLKRIDIYNHHTTPNTDDNSNIGFYLSLLGISSFFILLILYK